MNRLIPIFLILIAFVLIYFTGKPSLEMSVNNSGEYFATQSISTEKNQNQKLGVWETNQPDLGYNLTDTDINNLIPIETANDTDPIKLSLENLITGVVSEKTTLDKTVSDELKAYGNSLATEIINKFSQISEPQIIDRLIRNQDQISLERVSDLKKSYADLATKILAITPPEKIKTLSTQLAQAYSNQALALEKIALSELPVKQDLFLNYNSAVFATGDILQKIIIFFKSQKIVFSRNEAGFIFNLPF